MNTSGSVLIRYSILGLCVIFACVAPVHAAREETSGSIQQMMTPEEFRAAGLNKLSPDELQKLDAWLQGYRQGSAPRAHARRAHCERASAGRAAKARCLAPRLSAGHRTESYGTGREGRAHQDGSSCQPCG